MTDVLTAAEGWPAVLAAVPAGIDLEALARRHGALRRRRGVRGAAELLRLALAYGAGGLSLRGVAGWAAAGGIARLSDVALLNRLRGAADWLGAIAARLLDGAPPTVPARRPVRLIDATCVSRPGSRGTDWRLHLVYDPSRQGLAQLELTDAGGGEGLQRFPVTPGEIRIGDRGYAAPAGLRHVVEGGGDYLVRLGWNALRLRTPEGGPFDLFATLAKLGEQGEAAVRVVAGGRAGVGAAAPLPARLIARRKPPAAAARERRRLVQAAKRKGRTPDARSLRAADWILLLTSLDPTAVPAPVALELYRLRWQVELAFKRLKSLGHLDQLPAKDPDLARSWLYANLIAAILTDRQMQHLLAGFSP